MPRTVDFTTYKSAVPAVKDIDNDILLEVFRKKYAPDKTLDEYREAMGEKYGYVEASFGVGGEYREQSILDKVNNARKELAEGMREGLITPPRFERDPESGQLVKRNEVKPIDVARSAGKLAEGIGGFLPLMVVEPEGIPQLMKEFAQGIGQATWNIITQSPTWMGTINPWYQADAETLREIISDPFGHAALTMGTAFGGYHLGRRIGAIKTALTGSEIPDIGAQKRARMRAKADKEMGAVEGTDPTMQVPGFEEQIAQAPPDVPYQLYKPPTTYPRSTPIKLMNRFNEARKRYVGIARGDNQVWVRKHGESEFRKLDIGKERLLTVIETQRIPFDDVVLHRNGDVTVRMGKGDNHRVYRMERIEKEGKSLIQDNAQTKPPVEAKKRTTREPKSDKPPSEAIRALKGEQLYFVPPEVMALGKIIERGKSLLKQTLDHTIKASETTLRTKPGKLLKKEMAEVQDISGVKSSTWIERGLTTKLQRLSEAERINLSEVRDGVADPLNSRVSDVNVKMQKLYESIFDDIKEAGLKVVEEVVTMTKGGVKKVRDVTRDPREVQNFVPRRVKTDIALDVYRDLNRARNKVKKLQETGELSDKKLAKIIEGWVENANPIFKETTIDAMNMAIARGQNGLDALVGMKRAIGKEIFRPELKARTARFPDYFHEKDMGILYPQYVMDVARRIGEVKVWGEGNKKLVERLTEINNKDIAEAQIAEGLVEVFTGKAEQISRAPEPIQKAMDWATQYEVWTKIFAGTAAIPNAFQFGISFTPIFGIKNSVHAIGKLASDPKFRQFTKEASGMHTTTRAMQMFAGYDPHMGVLANRINKFLDHHPFNAFNRFNSFWGSATAELGLREWYRKANDPATSPRQRRIALDGLRKFEVDPRKPLTDELLQKRMHRAAINTQLLRNILKDPVHANDPRFRSFFLFQRFGFKQMRQGWNEFVKEAAHGNVRPLVTAAALGYLGGEFVSFAKDRTRELTEGLTNMALRGEYKFLPRYRRDNFLNAMKLAKDNPTSTNVGKAIRLFGIHAANNYAAVGSMGFFTDIFRVNDPRQAETPPDIASFLKRNITFAATPVIIRDLFINPSQEMDYFIKRWRDKGIQAAVDQLELGVLRNISPITRFVAGAVSEEERDYVFEMRKAIESGNEDAFWKVSEMARELGFDTADLFAKAIQQYKTRETQKLNRDMRIMEYNNDNEFRKIMQKEINP